MHNMPCTICTISTISIHDNMQNMQNNMQKNMHQICKIICKICAMRMPLNMQTIHNKCKIICKQYAYYTKYSQNMHKIIGSMQNMQNNMQNKLYATNMQFDMQKMHNM